MSNHIHYHFKRNSGQLAGNTASILGTWQYAISSTDLFIKNTAAPVKIISVNNVSTVLGNATLKSITTGGTGGGRVGSTGVAGSTGVQGATGVVAGSKGQVGPGVVVSTGATGLQGLTGNIGDNGLQGSTGVKSSSRGSTGNQGPPGVKGTTGTKGETGDTALQGEQGVQGPTGVVAPGATGPTGVLVIGSAINTFTTNMMLSDFSNATRYIITGPPNFTSSVNVPNSASFVKITNIGGGGYGTLSDNSAHSGYGGGGGGTVISISPLAPNSQRIECIISYNYGNYGGKYSVVSCPSISNYNNTGEIYDIQYSYAGYASTFVGGKGYATSGYAITLPGCNGYAGGALGGDGAGFLGGKGYTISSLTTIQYTVDGLNWCNIVSGGFDGYGHRVTSLNNLWFAVGRGRTNENSILISDNGSNWSNTSFDGTSDIPEVRGIAYGFNDPTDLWVAVGDGNISTNTLKWTTNGSDWSSSFSGGFKGHGNDVIYIPTKNIFIAIGHGAGDPYNTILSSTDGKNWCNAIDSGFSNINDEGGIYGEGKYLALSPNNIVAVGSGDSSQNNILYTGIDDITGEYAWSNAVSGGFYNHGNMVIYGNNLWVAVGSDLYASSTIQWSVDASNWHGVNTGGFNGNYGYSVAYGDGLYVAVGLADSPQSTIQYSSDGSNWCNAVTGGFSNRFPYTYPNGLTSFYDITSSNGYKVSHTSGYWAIAASGLGDSNKSIQYSSDGSNWYSLDSGGFTTPGTMYIQSNVYSANDIFQDNGLGVAIGLVKQTVSGGGMGGSSALGLGYGGGAGYSYLNKTSNTNPVNGNYGAGGGGGGDTANQLASGGNAMIILDFI